MLSRQLFQCQFLSLALIVVSIFYASASQAVLWADVRDTVFSGNSTRDCINCHNSGLAVGARWSAPEFADFDVYSESASRAALAASYAASDMTVGSTAAGAVAPPTNEFMPLDDTTTTADLYPSDGKDLNTTEKATLNTWAAQGAPLAAPTASNTAVLLASISKTGATLRGTINTQVHSATTLPGTYYFEYGVSGVNFTMGGGVATAVDQSATTDLAVTSPITGLTCETTYQYRVVATNGHSDTTDNTALTFKTDNCSAPVIRRGTTNAVATESYSVGKGASLDNAADFLLNATDADGTAALIWTLDGGQPAAGLAAVSGTGATPTVTYTAPADVPVPDTVTFNLLVSDDSNDGARTDRVTISIQIVDNPPSITNVTQPESITVLEDDVDGESVTLTATDADGDPLTWSVVGGTEPVNGSLNTLASGASQIVTYTPNANIDTDESFTVRVSDGTSSSDIVVNVDVTPQPDPPAAVADPDYEVLVNSANNTLDVLSNDTDLDTGDTKTLAAQAIVGSQGGTIVVNNPGVVNNTIDYTPATDVTVAETFTYTVTDSDGLTDTALVTVSPPDTDIDGVVDYIDNCAGTANGAAGDNQADNDGDQIINVNTTTDPADPLVGGDACDIDDDNDGITDIDEAMYPGCLDAFNAADATEDCDGDGLDNITEVNDGDANTKPDQDSVAPIVSAPADITVDATGLLTVVNLGTATGNDGNDGASLLFKAAVNLSPADILNLETPPTGCQSFSNYETDIEPFRPGTYEVTWVTCDHSGNAGHDSQTVKVKPLVSMISGQSVGEGRTVSIDVLLNGDAIAYPATVNYVVTGTANVLNDHDAVSGTVMFNNKGDVGVISFATFADDLVEGDETVIVTLHSPNNVALSNAKVHTVTITEANVAPQVILNATQSAAAIGNVIYQPDGITTIVANANDANGDTLSFDWSASNASLLAASTISTNQIDIDPTMLTVGGLYKVAVTVSDGALPVSVERLLLIRPAEVNVLTGEDDDGDGVDNITEGYGDDDADGIPNYIDNSFTPANAIENQTVDLATRMYIETNPGLHIGLGETAIAAQASGVLIGLQDIVDFGGDGGMAVSNASTDYTFLSALLDFEITWLSDAIASVHVVIPLQSAIQADAVYRKYNSAGWFDFVIDDNNEIRSAAGNDGACPQPGSNLYSRGLTVGDRCLQLTIEDGGANDADGVRNFEVTNSGGLALAPEPEAAADTSAAEANGRLGSLSLWSLLVLSMTAMLIWRIRLMRVKQLQTHDR